LLLFQVSICLSCSSQSYNTIVRQADSLYRAGQYQGSLNAFEKAFAIKTGSANDLYNAACNAALLKNNDKAFFYLGKSIDAGWEDLEYLKNESDFIYIRTDQRWKDMLEKLKVKLEKMREGYNLELQKELLAIYKDDQDERNRYSELNRLYPGNKVKLDSMQHRMLLVDSINTAKVSAILDKYGWVGPNKVGEKASLALFLVIQHSDLAHQKKYLPLLKQAVEKGDAEKQSLALLEDRIAIREGNLQTYGTQIGWSTKTNKYYVLPLKDPDNVDIRRREVGLGPISEYLRQWEIIWDAQKYKEQLPVIREWARDMIF
jgi:hypothetical protein